MEGINLAPILIPIGALLLGWVIGFFDSNLRTSKKIQAAENKAEAISREARNKIAEADARLLLAPSTASDNPGLLRLKEENGRLSLELDGAQVNPTALSADQKKRLIALLTLVRPWLEGAPASQVTPPPAAPVQTAPRPAAVAQSLFPTPTTPKIEEKAAAPLSIVGQIDAILQLRLINTPLAGQGIHLQESREGGAEVFVGATKYSGIDEVPDGEVKNAIRAAVSEWEMKYTPGL